MSNTVIFVGDKPSKRMKPGAKPFEGASCQKRLVDWIMKVTTEDDYIRTFNACDIKPIDDIELIHSVVIALGNNASKFLTKQGMPHFKLPHPSGLNRQVNDKAFIVSKLDECKKYIESFND